MNKRRNWVDVTRNWLALFSLQSSRSLLQLHDSPYECVVANDLIGDRDNQQQRSPYRHMQTSLPLMDVIVR